MSRFAQATTWGAMLLDPLGGHPRTRFRLWAPDAPQVLLEVAQHAPQAMNALGDGWHEVEAPVGAGAQYRFRVSDDLAVPDPASRLQAGDVHDASVVLDPHGYEWRHAGWQGRPWHEVVLYEVHAGAMGGFKGVQAALPRLKDLGVTAIELMPVNDSPGARNWGYDGVLPYAPDTALGTPEDLKALVDAAHGLGLMMFLDVVYNHFGPDGAYLHAYAKPFFDEGIHTPWGAAIDFKKPAVRSFFEDNALFWLNEYRFDGLRFDAVHAIAETDWLDVLGARIRREVAAQSPGRHVHLVLENERNGARHLRPGGAFDAQWNDDGHNILHPLLTGEREGYYEDFAEAGATKLATVLGEGFLFQGQRSEHLGAPRGEPSAHLPPTAFVLFLQNHDQVGNRAFGERLTALAEPQALAAATALLLLSPQIPMLFMGEEWGATAPFLFFTDHNAELAPLVTAGRRKEFSKFAAFQDPAKRERIPDPNAAATFTASIPDPAEARRPPHDAVLALHRRLLALRHRHIIPRLPGAQALGAEVVGEAAVLARWRLGDGAVLILACNLGAEAAVCTAQGTPLFESLAGAAGTLAGGMLPARCTVALLDA
ncbi:malto-oligosyltrehalose trehalohydrolase [Paracraurococcus ruber]|uniref:Malto-oligosyltrehalose trehalohydrolase n=1 Tax=Paracraurococcus ruber TaxID=77675 RepID=A0ABS1D311_9PROT|nr:malto-oligosyltrehalose trehalohydrolase [Paracraurococcus ruber]MBK1660289.1 malto-oligosyltrehalose trehalohydrolase [Paracraurococcus ruber]TDG29724.1 malto-oligosyltrehalose trehalohydrolase [Paracraurococcus ruber]